MHPPHSLSVIENCADCKLRSHGYFCDLPADSLKAFESLKYSTVFPKGAVLFLEGFSPRGIFMLCAGRVKLSSCSSEGKSLITRIAEPGEILGLSATISGKPYMVTAETLDPCHVSFIKRQDFLHLLAEDNRICLGAAGQLSNNCYAANEQARSLGLTHTAGEKLARLILEWCAQYGKQDDRGIQLKLTLTHEEVAQLIGSSRETVTRLLSSFKSDRLIYVNGSTLIVRNKVALETMVGL